MDVSKIKGLLERYYEGNTTSEEEELIQEYFSLNNIDETLEMYKSEFRYFKEEKRISLRPEKKDQLLGHIRKQHTPFYDLNKWFRYAAIVLGFGLVYILGYQHGGTNRKTDIDPEKTKSSSVTNDIKGDYVRLLINQNLAPSRIKAVSMVGEISMLKGEILEEIINVLRYDENENVRLAALATLSGFIKNEQIRTKIIDSIPYQNSIMVVYDMLNIPQLVQAKDAQLKWLELFNKKQTPQEVRDEIENILP